MQIGIELGIRAPFEAIEKAAKISEKHLVKYFLVPETHPKFFGVDAFQTLLQLSDSIKKIKLGTGIVNVFSRSKEEIADLTYQINQKTNGNFVLGIGTSAPVIVEQLWKIDFKKPLTRLENYSSYIKKKFSGPVFWAAVGQKTTDLAAANADGVIFFLKPESQMSDHIDLINNKLTSLGKSKNDFEVISIVPTYFDETVDQFQAKMTLAGYIGANEFYSVPLINAGFEKEVSEIIGDYKKFGLKEAAKNVKSDLVDELTISGSLEACIDKIIKQQDSKSKNIILGFDLPKEKYTDDFFEKLDKLLTSLE